MRPPSAREAALIASAAAVVLVSAVGYFSSLPSTMDEQPSGPGITFAPLPSLPPTSSIEWSRWLRAGSAATASLP